MGPGNCTELPTLGTSTWEATWRMTAGVVGSLEAPGSGLLGGALEGADVRAPERLAQDERQKR